MSPHKKRTKGKGGVERSVRTIFGAGPISPSKHAETHPKKIKIDHTMRSPTKVRVRQ